MFNRNENGFTLVEALIIVVIIGIIAAVAIPKYMDVREKSERTTCQANISIIQSAVESYRAQDPKNKYPINVKELVDKGFLTSLPKCPSGGTYTINTGSGKVKCSIHGEYGEF